MPKIIQRGQGLIRINTQKNTIEFSVNSGRSWITRFNGTGAGVFYDLLDYGSEILASTSKGIYVSMTDGQSWIPRYRGTDKGIFGQLASDGSNILANTSRGLFASTNGGRSWIRRSF